MMVDKLKAPKDFDGMGKQLTPSLNFDVSSAYEEIICET